MTFIGFTPLPMCSGVSSADVGYLGLGREAALADVAIQALAVPAGEQCIKGGETDEDRSCGAGHLRCADCQARLGPE